MSAPGTLFRVLPTGARVLRILAPLSATFAAAALLACVRERLFNPVGYTLESVAAPRLAATLLVPTLVLAVVGGLGWAHVRSRGDRASGLEERTPPGSRIGGEFATILLSLGAAAAVLLFACGSAANFWGWCGAVALLTASLARWDCAPRPFSHWERSAPWVLGALILIVTIWHATRQAHYWQHFLLGYADFGFFATELEHCLPWKEVGADRFADTRLGYHAIWMFYLLAPFYAVFRSPLFLMFVGPLALNCAAAAFYQLARERSGSRLVGLIVGVAWLSLPSVTRLPYSNTYGFQSVYLAVPWLAFAFSLGLRGRWGASHACLAAAMLCEETVCGVAFGWGATLALLSSRRRDGLILMALSAAYLLVAAGLVIPAFTSEDAYTRLRLFGDTAASDLAGRLIRERSILLTLAMAVPLLPGLMRGWRWLPAALPTLVLVLMIQEDDYLNIKYWHQSTILPVLFAAATVGVATTGRSRRSSQGGENMPGAAGRDAGAHGNGTTAAAPDVPRDGGLIERSSADSGARIPLAPPLALLVGVALFHFVMGFSPFAQAERLHASEPRLKVRDPRLEVVEFVRRRFPPDQYSVHATERMAAHFTNYRTVRPVSRNRLRSDGGSGTVLVFDRSDHWDKVVRENQGDAYLAESQQTGFQVVETRGAVVILVKPPTSDHP